ncbi:MAG: hypothetical protein HDS62_01900 [Bacteroidales bacterium]|nr:hypothetical protein [Bacteroidales bacterium]
MDCYNDLRFNQEEWMSKHDFDTQTQEEFIYDLYLTGYDTSQKWVMSRRFAPYTIRQ